MMKTIAFCSILSPENVSPQGFYFLRIVPQIKFLCRQQPFTIYVNNFIQKAGKIYCNQNSSSRSAVYLARGCAEGGLRNALRRA